jgi:hypothetical protein
MMRMDTFPLAGIDDEALHDDPPVFQQILAMERSTEQLERILQRL